jgi:SPP1 gp7 family putative phage head morphogenesis protein
MKPTKTSPKKYRYVATLDSRTSSICAALDGREFEYGKGPMPPQHFNCRSTTVPIDYDPDILAAIYYRQTR